MIEGIFVVEDLKQMNLAMLFSCLDI